VDEAQDLSPMQARSIARRSATGSLTVVGDLAQSTGAWARDDWSDLLEYLPSRYSRAVVALRYGYRVPRRVYDLASRLLPLAAPGVPPLTVVREGPANPRLHRVDGDERPGRAATLAMEHARQGRYVGIICAPSRRQELADALTANQVAWSGADRIDPDSAVNLVSAEEAKGLEFDAVVVVEPEEIVASDERGHRMLFIALTRTTRYLDIVAIGEPLPVSATAAPRIPRQRTAPDDAPPFDQAALEALARQVAATMVGGSPAQVWDEVLRRVAAMLDEQRGGGADPSGRHHRRD
jgi:DNA helicase IV